MDSSESESESDDDTATPDDSSGTPPEVNGSTESPPEVNGSGKKNGYKYVSVVNVGPSENSPPHQNGKLSSDESSEEDEEIEDGQSVTVISVQDSSKDNDIVQFLDKETDHAEARLAAKRQARAEAREIRMREIERQQKENDDSSVYDTASPYSSTPSDGGGSRSSGVGIAGRINSAPRLNSYQSSRRSSEDSLEESSSLRDVRNELREVEDKFRKAMIGNAQLDNEKTAAIYQVELYKDRYEEMEESYAQLQREHREKCRELDQLKRDSEKLNKELIYTRAALEERDRLIQEQGLVIVGGDTSSSESCGEDDEDDGKERTPRKEKHKRALVSADMANLLDTAGKGSLDVRLKRLAAERNDLSDELRHVKLELEEERAKLRSSNSADMEELQIEEVSKQIGDYKFKLQKAEQDISTLQTTVTRLESQVARYKTSTETLEKSEETLKVERRKLLRELRESQARVEELETAHTHLQKRLDKLKNAKSALLKDL